MELTTLIWLLPLIFMLHDFEEIIMMQAWYNKNKDDLQARFPRLGKRIVATYQNLSTASFSLAVLEEFIILSVAALLAIEFDNLLLWTASFLAFFIHLFIHIVQWIVIRRYIPAIITTFLALPYCFYTLNVLINKSIYNMTELSIIFFVGFGYYGSFCASDFGLLVPPISVQTVPFYKREWRGDRTRNGSFCATMQK